jgi:hypothetical protein
MKSLEDIIKQNREEFDTEIPSELLWNNIHANLHKHKSSFAWKPYMAAASIMIFIMGTWLIANYKFDSKNSTVAQSAIPNEVKEAQVQFASLIELKRTELNSYRDAHPELINEFDKQLTELKQNYSGLLPQLKDANKRDIVLQAVIENLQMQVNILNQQIEIINQLKTQQNETNNPIQL